MIPLLLFPVIAVLLVLLAGRSDPARDPRLSVLTLVLLAVFPLSIFLPKAGILPVDVMDRGEAGLPWQQYLIGLWVIGGMVSFVRLTLAAKIVFSWCKRSSPAGWATESVEIRQVPGLSGPMATGVWRKLILVPDAWAKWPDATRRMILEHELAHHRRCDPLWRWIAELACVAQGGNPLVIWISRRLALQCEFACDASVLSQGSREEDYARLLCEFAMDGAPAGPVLAMAATSSLESRVRRLMKPQQNRGNVAIITLIGLTLALAGALAVLGPTAPEPTDAELRWSANPFPGER